MDASEVLAGLERQRAAGDEAAAEEGARRLLALLSSTFAPDVEARAALLLGELLVAREAGREAGPVLEAAVSRAVEAGLPLVEADAWYALAMAAFDDGRSKDGHDALLEAMALARGLDGDDARRSLARSIRAYGEHVGVLGSTKEGREALALARAMYADLADEAEVAGIDADAKDLDFFGR